MPIVRQSWVKTPEALEKYLAKDRNSETVTTASDGLADEMASSIRAEHEKFKKNAKNLALTIIQSWHEKESNLLTPDKYNEMGQELAKRFAPGHLAWVVTHTEKNHIHNHIVICSVNSETGKLLNNKRSELAKLHEANNAIARENGFAVLEPKVKAFEARLPQKVKSMVARGKKSWLFDLEQKADFSRAASTSFDEYVGSMKGLGIDVRVEDKNISYFYGDHKKAIRGKSLGTNYNKEGLIQAFKENDGKFANNSGLRERIRADIGAAFDDKGRSLGTPSDLLLESASHPGLGKKDYNKFTKIDRSLSRDELPAIFDKRGGLLYEEMMKARKTSLFDYCEQHKIQLTKDKEGQTVLRGREFVVFKSSSEWKNTKNGTNGTIIDFVAIHDETNYLRAVAKINNNPRLLMLEPVMGEYKRGFQSFYIPNPKSASPQTALQTMHKFLNARGMKGEAAPTLLKSGRVYVGKDLSIWLMGEKNESALEFREDSKGNWKQKRHGKPTGAFFESVGRAKQMLVFRDPFEFALLHAKGAVPKHEGANIFAMMGDHSKGRLNELLALNPHITELHFVQSGRPSEREHERRMNQEMKVRFNPFDIQVKEFLGDLGKAKDRGPDISM